MLPWRPPPSSSSGPVSDKNDPDFLRRFDYEGRWSAALPGVAAEIMKLRYALAEALS